MSKCVELMRGIDQNQKIKVTGKKIQFKVMASPSGFFNGFHYKNISNLFTQVHISMKFKSLFIANKIVVVTLIFFGIGYASSAWAEDDCQMWTHRGYPVELGVCSYSNGGSGYTLVTNNGDKSATICWEIVANNGNRERRCHSNFGPGETDKASAFQCGTKTKYGGCSQILLQSYEVNR